MIKTVSRRLVKFPCHQSKNARLGHLCHSQTLSSATAVILTSALTCSPPRQMFPNIQPDFRLPTIPLEASKSIHLCAHGQHVSFESIVTNVGTNTCFAQNGIADMFSAGLTYVSGGSVGVWTCPVGPISGSNSAACTSNQTLAQGQSSLFGVEFKVRGIPGEVITNCAMTSNPQDSNATNNLACAVFQIAKPDGPPSWPPSARMAPKPSDPAAR